MKIISFIFSTTFAITANASGADSANGYMKVDGSYLIASKNLIDPAPTEKKDRAAFFLVGATAKDMYDHMPVPEKKDACSNALRTKTAGGLLCSKDITSNEYQCTFGVILKTGALVDASVC